MWGRWAKPLEFFGSSDPDTAWLSSILHPTRCVNQLWPRNGALVGGLHLLTYPKISATGALSVTLSSQTRMEKHIICMFIGLHDEFKANHSAKFKNHSQTWIKTMAMPFKGLFCYTKPIPIGWSTTHSTSTHTFFATRSAAGSRFGRLTSRPGRWTQRVWWRWTPASYRWMNGWQIIHYPEKFGYLVYLPK